MKHVQRSETEPIASNSMIHNPWEEEFDKKFTNRNAKLPISETMLFEPTTSKIKAFIKKEIEKVTLEYEGKIEKQGKKEQEKWEKYWVKVDLKDRQQARTEALEDLSGKIETLKVYPRKKDGKKDGIYVDYLRKIEVIEIIESIKKEQ